MNEEIRVLVADDEQTICTGLREIVEGMELDGLRVFTAVNGHETWEILRGQGIDIAIIDINMPGRDGLDVIREAFENKLPVRFLILSGYSEFSYAQTAIRYGVKSYFLKPLNIEDFRTVFLQQCRELLRSRASDGAGLRSSTRAMMLGRLIHGHINGVDIDYSELAIGQGSALAVVFQPALLPDGESSNLELISREILQPAFAAWPVEFCLEGGSRLIAVFNLADSADPAFRRDLQRALEQVQERTGSRLWAGLGNAVSSPEHIHTSVLHAQEALSYHIYYTDTQIYDFDLIRWQNPSFSRESIDLGPLVQAILSHRTDDIEAYIEAFFTNLLSDGMPPPSFVIGMCMYLILNTQHQVEDVLPERRIGLDSPYERISAQETIQQIRQWLVNLFIQYSDALKEARGEDDAVIRQAKAYIRQNIGKAIKAKDVAAHVNLSESYFTIYFKEKTGVNFRDYLLKERIGLARQLLRSRSANISEVADRTGYQDYRSFTRAFKNETGMTPSEYQKQFLDGSKEGDQ